MSSSSPPSSAVTAAHWRRFAQHLVATPAGLLLLGLLGHWPPSLTVWDQIGVGVVGTALTAVLRNQDLPGRRYLQAVVPVLTAVAAVLVPVAVDGGKLAVLTGVAGLVPLLHVLAGAGNALTPTRQSAAAKRVTESAVAALPVNHDIPEPPVARTGGAYLASHDMGTTRMKVLGDDQIAEMDAAKAAGTSTLSTTPPAAAEPATPSTSTTPAGFTTNPAPTARRLGFGSGMSSEDHA